MEEIEVRRSGRTAGDARPRTRPARVDLLARLWAATEPDRALDGRIEVVIRWAEAASVGLKPEHRARWESDQHGWVRNQGTVYESAPFTRSLDAAMSLIERVLPSKRLELFRRPADQWMVNIGDYDSVYAPTAPLAVLIAVLAALPADGAPLRQDETDASPRGGDSRSEGMDT